MEMYREQYMRRHGPVQLGLSLTLDSFFFFVVFRV